MSTLFGCAMMCLCQQAAGAIWFIRSGPDMCSRNRDMDLRTSRCCRKIRRKREISEKLEQPKWPYCMQARAEKRPQLGRLHPSSNSALEIGAHPPSHLSHIDSCARVEHLGREQLGITPQ